MQLQAALLMSDLVQLMSMSCRDWQKICCLGKADLEK